MFNAFNQLLVLGATSPFTKLNAFVKSITTDVLNTGFSLAILGFIVCAIGAWRGSEEHVPKFQKGLTWTGIAVAVMALAKIIVPWIKAGVA